MLSVITLEELKRQLATHVFIKLDKRQSMQFIPAHQERAPHIVRNGAVIGYHVLQEKEDFFIVIAGERYRLMDIDLDRNGMIRMFAWLGKKECYVFQRRRPATVAR